MPVITLRLTDEEKAHVDLAAETRGQSLQTWLVRLVRAGLMQQAMREGGHLKVALDRLAGVAGDGVPKTRAARRNAKKRSA
jgi:hypothetical protein